MQLSKVRKALIFRKQDKIVNIHVLSEGYEESYIFMTTSFAFFCITRAIFPSLNAWCSCAR
jgi:hypothetical protein